MVSAAKNGGPQRSTAPGGAATAVLTSGNRATRNEVAALPPRPRVADDSDAWDERTVQVVHDVLLDHGVAQGTQLGPEDDWTVLVGSTAEFLVDLAECFDLTEPDRQGLKRATTIGGLVQILRSRPGKSDWMAKRTSMPRRVSWS